MRKLLAIALVILIVLPLSVTLHAQDGDPADVVIAAYEAFNAGDLDAFVALYTEGAVVDIQPFGVYTGADEIRAWAEPQIDYNASLEYEIINAEDSTVTVESVYTSDEFPFSMEAVEVYVITDGLVQSHTWTPTRETQEKLGIWWPSPWGADDEIGATNRITPKKVMEATDLIQKGVIYELGRPYEAAMPLFPGRTFQLLIPSAPTLGPLGKNRIVAHEDYLATQIGQVGTQFDGLNHVGIHLGEPGDLTAMHFYNGITEAELASGRGGLLKLGVEKVKPIFTRGVLIDVAGLKGRMLEAGEEITLDEVLAALERQGMSSSDIRPGDAVLFNTGWGSLWIVDNAKFNNGAPGIGLDVAGWLIEKEIVVAGSDNWPLEVVPNPDPELVFPVHAELITKNGIHIQENLDLSALIADEVYEFAYIYVRMPIVGATGSPGSPIAVR